MVKNWVRYLLGALGILVAALTIPAFFSPSANPALAGMTSLSMVAVIFLNRQLAIALTAIYGAWKGAGNAVLIGAVPMFLFNAFDVIAILIMGTINMPAIIAGLVLAALAAVVIYMATRRLEAYE